MPTSNEYSIIGLIFIVALIFFTMSRDNPAPFVAPENYESLSIASWNLQIFGQDKAKDPQVLNSIVDKVRNYDIVFLQEIKDESGLAPKVLCNALKGYGYSCQISSRAGTTQSKEQYLFVYKNNFTIIQFIDLNQENETRWERPPVKAVFQINYAVMINQTNYETRFYNLTIWGIHVKPDNAVQEIKELELLIPQISNTIVLGDLNMDCDYYDNDKEPYFIGWKAAISSDLDTTVSSTNCAYDRIFLDNELYLRMRSFGIDSIGITEDVSDHNLVYTYLTKDNSIVQVI